MYVGDENLSARELLLGALEGLYAEEPGIVGNSVAETLVVIDHAGVPKGKARALRANERAIAARLAVHIDRTLYAVGSLLTVDVEYSRVLLGVASKMGRAGQIFPDLLVHRRGAASRNLLAVELKTGVPSDPAVVDQQDDRKMRHLTNENWMLGQSAYSHGVCLQLAYNRGRLHWYEDGAPVTHEDWTPRQ